MLFLYLEVLLHTEPEKFLDKYLLHAQGCRLIFFPAFVLQLYWGGLKEL